MWRDIIIIIIRHSLFLMQEGGGGDVVCHCCFVTGEQQQQHQEINALPVTYKMSRHQENMRAKALNLLSVCVCAPCLFFSIGLTGRFARVNPCRERRDPFHLIVSRNNIEWGNDWRSRENHHHHHQKTIKTANPFTSISPLLFFIISLFCVRTMTSSITTFAKGETVAIDIKVQPRLLKKPLGPLPSSGCY